MQWQSNSSAILQSSTNLKISFQLSIFKLLKTNLKRKHQEKTMDEEQQAGVNEKNKVIPQIYYGSEGGQPAHKTWLEAKAINPSITLDWVKSWFRLNIQPTKQVGGAQNSYVAPLAYHEYQADLFYITAKQFPNQDFPWGL